MGSNAGGGGRAGRRAGGGSPLDTEATYGPPGIVARAARDRRRVTRGQTAPAAAPVQTPAPRERNIGGSPLNSRLTQASNPLNRPSVSTTQRLTR